MILYFEIHFDDTGGYWTDNFKEVNDNTKLIRGFDLNYIEGSNRDDYSIIVDLNCDFKGYGGDIFNIINKEKEKILS